MIMQSPLPTVDRTKLRMEKLRQLELEQLQWEQEALVMPESLNRALFLSFESVKTEFSDLDGLSWSRYPVPLVTNPWDIEEPTPRPAEPPTLAHSPTRPHHRRLPAAFPFTPQDTIRVSRLPKSSRSPLQPANQRFSPQYRDSPTHALSCCLRQPTCAGRQDR